MTSNGVLKRRTRAAAAATVLVAVAGTAVVAAPAASAWTWSSSVTLTGTAGCGGAQRATVRGVFNEQHQLWTAYARNTYSITFTNVPAGGGWAWVWSDCSVTSDHGTWVRVTRPVFGSTIGANLGAAY